MTQDLMVWFWIVGNVGGVLILLLLLWKVDFGDELPGESDEDYEMKTAEDVLLEKLGLR